MVQGPSTAELLVRLVFSLGVIVGLLLLAAKVARRNGGSLKLPGIGSIGGARKRVPVMEVVERHSLTRAASLALVRVGERTLVVGVTEHGVSLLADDVVEAAADADEAVAEADAPTEAVRPVTEISAVREAKGTLPLASGDADAVLDAARHPERPARMSFVDALREMTVRSA